MLMTLIVVVASQVCAHVQTLQITYIKYVQFFAYQVYFTSCLKKTCKNHIRSPKKLTKHTHSCTQKLN